MTFVHWNEKEFSLKRLISFYSASVDTLAAEAVLKIN